MFWYNMDGGKSYIRFLSNCGYALADLFGAAVAIWVYCVLQDWMNSILLVLGCILLAGALAFCGCMIIGLITASFRKNEKNISLPLHIIMSLIIGALWQYLWVGHTMEYLDEQCGQHGRCTVGWLCMYMFVPFYSIFWFYQYGSKCDFVSEAQGAVSSNRKVLYLLLGIFIPFVASIVMQHEINGFERQKTLVTSEV